MMNTAVTHECNDRLYSITRPSNSVIQQHTYWSLFVFVPASWYIRSRSGFEFDLFVVRRSGIPY